MGYIVHESKYHLTSESLKTVLAKKSPTHFWDYKTLVTTESIRLQCHYVTYNAYSNYSGNTYGLPMENQKGNVSFSSEDLIVSMIWDGAVIEGTTPFQEDVEEDYRDSTNYLPSSDDRKIEGN